MNYYSHFYKSALYRLYEHIDNKLMRWARRKYRKLAGKPRQARNRALGTSPKLVLCVASAKDFLETGRSDSFEESSMPYRQIQSLFPKK
jgi:hypothetical protein